MSNLTKLNEQLDAYKIMVDKLLIAHKDATDNLDRAMGILLLFHDAIGRAKKDGFHITNYLNDEEVETLQTLIDNNRTEI